jgi:hypothetical protein
MIAIQSRPDPALSARIVQRVPMRYADGADPALDRPAHVRSASGLAWLGGRLMVIQDDAAFLAEVDPATGLARGWPLPAGEDGRRQFDDLRGNKHLKLDLESCVTVQHADGGEVLLAFGSGSLPLRERIVRARRVDGALGTEVIDAAPLYAALRAERAFSGSELNLEGAALLGDALVLCNRGNGASVDGIEPVNAHCHIDLAALLRWLDAPSAPLPSLDRVQRYELGSVHGIPLTFTDLATAGDTLLYAAAAEDSPDAVRDGVVVGAALGCIGDGVAAYAQVQREDGSPSTEKIEGILATADGRLLAVVDPDDPTLASELLTLELRGYGAVRYRLTQPLI